MVLSNNIWHYKKWYILNNTFNILRYQNIRYIMVINDNV